MGVSLFGQETINSSITHDGIQREYLLYVPAIYDGNVEVPLLFNFHGYSSNAVEQLFYGDFRSIADTANFIIVHPQGTLDDTGTTHFNVGWGGSSADDVGYTSALIDSISAMYAIDADRIYSTGMSNGGYMSFKLACELSERITAVASVTGAMVPPAITSCSPEHMTPILQIHGTADETVPYEGAIWSASIPEILDYWVGYNGLIPTPITVALPDVSPSDGSTVDKLAYTDDTGCVKVLHFRVNNGSHTWPGASFDLGGTNYDFNASATIWEFLSQFDLNGVIDACQSTYVVGITPQSFRAYPNPTYDKISIDGLPNGLGHVQLFSISGELLFEDDLSLASPTIDLSMFPSGIYLLKLGDQIMTISKL